MYKISLFTLALLSLLLRAPGAGAEDYVVGGKDASSKGDLGGAVVALYSQSARSGALCTATLISGNFALTAAHCVEQGISNTVVIFADNIHSSGRTMLRVVEAKSPPQWREPHPSGTDFGDIAVIRLEGKLPRGYHPAHLAPANLKLTRGEKVLLAGYGISHVRNQAGAGQLRRTTVSVVEPDLGHSEMVFDQTKGSGACHGDSGGPAFAERKGRLYLVGVTNRGYPDAAPDDCAQEVVYAKVGVYRRWITETTRSMRH